MATMLDAVINLKDNFSSTLSNVEKNVGQFSRTTKTMGRDISRTGKSMESTGKTLTKSLTLPLLAMGAGAVKVGMEFESSMSEVAATMGITVDEIENGSKEFEMLEKAAKDMGATTQYSASEAAEALNYLALAGYDAEQSTELLPKVLNLAAAGGLELAYASDMVTDSMSALGLSIGEADVFIDEMAKTAQSSNTSVEQLGEAILTVGANGKDLANGTLELNTAIGLLGNAGIKGAEAGTKLRNIIMALNPTTDKAVQAFKDLGVSTYDANGNLRPMNESMLDMSKSMEGLTMKEKQDIMGGIFNKQDMAAAATLLASVTQSTEDLDYALAEMGISTKQMNLNLDDVLPVMEEMGDKQQSVDHIMQNYGATIEEAEVIYSGLMGVMGDDSAWDDLEGKIDNAQGTAQEMADTLMYNLKGAFTKIKGAMEGVGIKIYEILLPALEKGAEYVQKFVDKINDLTPEQTDMIGKFVKLGIVIGPALMILGKMTGVVGGVVKEFGFLAGRIGKIGFIEAIFTPGVKVALILAAIIAVGILLYKNWDKIKAKAEEIFPGIGQKISEVFGSIGETISHMIEVVVPMLQQGFEFIKEIMMIGLGLVLELWNTHGTSIMETVTLMWELVKTVFSTAMAIIGGVISVAVGVMQGIWSRYGETIINLASTAWDTVSSLIGAALDIIKGIIKVATGLISGDWGKVWEGMKDIISGVWEGIKGVVKGGVNGVIDLMNGMIGGMNKLSIPDWVPGIGGKGINIPLIPKLAKGTKSWGGGIAQVHERGGEIIDLPGKSRVYPHDKSVSMARKQGQKEASESNGVIVTGNTFNVRKESDIDSIASALYRKMNQASINMI